MPIYIVRHAQTHGNVARRLQGSSSASTGLTEHGRQEAEALAAHLKQANPAFASLYSSDAVRARQTATILGEALALPIKFSAALREINCGEWEDKSQDELSQLYPDAWRHWQDDPLTFYFPQGENLVDVQRRVGSFFDELHRENWGNLLLVSHSATISALMAHVHGWDLLEAWLSGRAMHRNTAFSVLTFGEFRGKLMRSEIALTDHL